MAIKKHLLITFLTAITVTLGGCSSTGYTGNNYGDSPNVADAVPKYEPLSRSGNSSYVMRGKRYHVLKTAKGYDKVGYASWYGKDFHGKRTSNREKYNMYAMTAASKTLPIPSYVRVTNLSNGRSIVVRVNDRGPFRSNRIIDLSYAAAKKLGYINKGTQKVRVTAIVPDNRPTYLASNDTTSIPEEKSAAVSPVYLQVGAFSKRQNAEKLSKQLAQSTQTKVMVKPTYKRKTKVYRVHIGPVLNDKEFALVKEQLKVYGYPNPMVVTG